MRRITCTVLLLLLGFSFSWAQIDAYNAAKHVIIKYSPAAMFDSDNTIQFGVEVPLGKSGISLQQDLGYGHSGFNLWYHDITNAPNKSTYKSRTHLRYYYFSKSRVRGYFAGEFLYKKVLYRDNQWVGMDCSSFGDCNYFENKDVTIGRIAAAGHARMGWQFYFPSRMTLDLFTGFGMRDIKVKALSPGLETARVRAPREIWSETTPGTHYVMPSLVLGFHLGVVLGKIRQNSQ
ncbi:DUF3575 domain-containing protein [Dyadobacter crusticola]|uniref:DUF3575 domain-containing protein n=1 Tax=Dyadobacter crusticola TaxID=292407 RepID=UPI0012F7ABA9|nr:DUF3575 domain-containing protein [Dyadobacter crusticola]